MDGHLYLHIGPPKSGTTSLQYALERIEHPEFLFGGVYQPRERNAGSLAHRLHGALVDEGDGARSSGITVRDEISRLVAEGKHVVLSEEMLLLTQRKRTWQSKLHLLREWVDGIPTTVILTLRDPLEAVPSLYQELFVNLSLRHKLSFSQFCESDIASCYDFSLVRQELDRLGFKDIRILTFDCIRTGRVASGDLFGERDILGGSEVPIGHANAGDKKNGAIQRRLAGVTLKSLGQLTPARWVVDRLGLRSTPFYQRVVALLDSVTLRPADYRELVVPERLAVRFASGYRQTLAEWEQHPEVADPHSVAASRECR